MCASGARSQHLDGVDVGGVSGGGVIDLEWRPYTTLKLKSNQPIDATVAAGITAELRGSAPPPPPPFFVVSERLRESHKRIHAAAQYI